MLAVGAVWGVFIYVMASRVEKLNTHPKAVNVEIVHPKSLPFPTVTICNQNYFRLAKERKITLTYDF